VGWKSRLVQKEGRVCVCGKAAAAAAAQLLTPAALCQQLWLFTPVLAERVQRSGAHQIKCKPDNSL
jgi:hypothetical protein